MFFFLMSGNRISLNVKTKGNRTYEDVSARIILSIVSILSQLLSQLLLSLIFYTEAQNTISKDHQQASFSTYLDATQRGHAHVKEHSVEDWHGDELRRRKQHLTTLMMKKSKRNLTSSIHQLTWRTGARKTESPVRTNTRMPVNLCSL